MVQTTQPSLAQTRTSLTHTVLTTQVNLGSEVESLPCPVWGAYTLVTGVPNVAHVHGMGRCVVSLFAESSPLLFFGREEDFNWCPVPDGGAVSAPGCFAAARQVPLLMLLTLQLIPTTAAARRQAGSISSCWKQRMKILLPSVACKQSRH